MIRLACGSVFMVAFVVYLPCLYPAYKLDDSPNTVAACLKLVPQHMPGYPLVTFLGKLATLVPAGSPYFRINLLAAVAAALTATAVVWTGMRLAMGAAGIAGGVLAGLAFAFSGLLWGNAVSAKGAIYGLNAMLLAGFLGLVVSAGGRVSGSGGRLLLAGLLTGSALANHWMSAVMWLPAFALFAWPWKAREVALAATATGIGLSLYLLLPLRAFHEPFWQNTSEFGGVMAMVLRTDLTAGLAGKSVGLMVRQVGWGSVLLVREAGIGMGVLVLVGAWALWRRERRLAMLPLSGALLTLAGVVFMASPVESKTGSFIPWVTANFHLPILVAGAVLASVGAGVAMQRVRRGRVLAGWSGLFLVVVLPLLWKMPVRIHSRDYLGPDYAWNLQESLPTGSVVASLAGSHLFPLLAREHVDRGMMAPETLPIYLLQRKWGWKYLADRFPEARIRGLLADPSPEDAGGLLSRLATVRPLYLLMNVGIPLSGTRLQRQGFFRKVSPGADSVVLQDEDAIRAQFRRYRLRGLLSHSPFKDAEVLTVLDQYAVARAQGGEYARTNGDVAGALAVYRRAVRFPGRNGLGSVWRSLGLAAAIEQDHVLAEEAFREAVRLKPVDPELWANLGVACSIQGKRTEAVEHLKYALRLKPGYSFASKKLKALGE